MSEEKTTIETIEETVKEAAEDVAGAAEEEAKAAEEAAKAREAAEKAKIEAAEKTLSKRFQILLAVGGCILAGVYGLWVFGFFK